MFNTKHNRILVRKENILFDLLNNIFIDETANVTMTSMKKVEKNETLITEIPIERIDKSPNRFRFQVIQFSIYKNKLFFIL